MRESDFIKQNKSNWTEFEKEWSNTDPRPGKIAQHYIEIVDDLSFARTQYPNRMVRSYLNGAAENLSIRIQRSRKQNWTNIKKFWRNDLPLVMFESRKQFLLAFSIFAIAVVIGIFSSMYDKNFAASILGEDYIETTLRNIEKKEPMAIYRSSESSDMFFSITLNNTFIAVKTFLLSLFVGIGSVVILLFNGVMLGVFQYFFIERGLFIESFLTIWQHGVIEISSIILAGCAGLVLAKGILFPGTYSRIDSFRLAGRKGLIIMMGILPLLIYSGIIESWVTRQTDVHWSLRLLSILVSLFFVLFYFVFYPRKLAKRSDYSSVIFPVKIPIKTKSFEKGTIQNNVIFWWEGLHLALKHYKSYVLISIVLIAMLVGVNYYFTSPQISSFYNQVWMFTLNKSSMILFFIFLASSVSLLYTQYLMMKRNVSLSFVKISFRTLISTLVLSISFAFFTLLSFYSNWLLIFWIFLLPIFGNLYSVFANNTGSGFKKTNIKFQKSFGVAYPRLLKITIASSAIYLLLTIFSYKLIEMIINGLIGNLFTLDGMSIYIVSSYIQLSVGFLLFYSFLTSLFLSYAHAYSTIDEIVNAENLQSSIQDSFQVHEDAEMLKVSLLRKEQFQ